MKTYHLEYEKRKDGNIMIGTIMTLSQATNEFNKYLVTSIDFYNVLMYRDGNKLIRSSANEMRNKFNDLVDELVLI